MGHDGGVHLVLLNSKSIGWRTCIRRELDAERAACSYL